MSKFIVFTLESHMASFGDLAGHERRRTGLWPARSALMGLIGAALGVTRDDKAGLVDLAALSFAVAVFDSGVVARDFHTAQAVHQKIKRPATRAIALAKGANSNALNTVLTKRDYRCSVSYGVAAWGESIDLESLRDALEKPVYTLYLGRKSCPLSAPVNAKVVEADSPAAAVEHIVLPPWRMIEPDNQKPPVAFIASDAHPALKVDYIESQFDIPIDRERWHFQERDIHIVRGESR